MDRRGGRRTCGSLSRTHLHLNTPWPTTPQANYVGIDLSVGGQIMVFAVSCLATARQLLLLGRPLMLVIDCFDNHPEPSILSAFSYLTTMHLYSNAL